METKLPQEIDSLQIIQIFDQKSQRILNKVRIESYQEDLKISMDLEDFYKQFDSVILEPGFLLINLIIISQTNEIDFLEDFQQKWKIKKLHHSQKKIITDRFKNKALENCEKQFFNAHYIYEKIFMKTIKNLKSFKIPQYVIEANLVEYEEEFDQNLDLALNSEPLVKIFEMLDYTVEIKAPQVLNSMNFLEMRQIMKKFEVKSQNCQQQISLSHVKLVPDTFKSINNYIKSIKNEMLPQEQFITFEILYDIRGPNSFSLKLNDKVFDLQGETFNHKQMEYIYHQDDFRKELQELTRILNKNIQIIFVNQKNGFSNDEQNNLKLKQLNNQISLSQNNHLFWCIIWPLFFSINRDSGVKLKLQFGGEYIMFTNIGRNQKKKPKKGNNSLQDNKVKQFIFNETINIKWIHQQILYRVKNDNRIQDIDFDFKSKKWQNFNYYSSFQEEFNLLQEKRLTAMGLLKYYHLDTKIYRKEINWDIFETCFK